ncbi:MAG: 6-phosphogluconolactonase [Planctomycetota bacterium]|nr:MAG: 6-phosphogluconolactonase [Planctomycetota bacterium]
MKPLRVVENAEELSRIATEEVLRAAGEAIAARGSFFVALAGGSTPRMLYQRLAAAPGVRFRRWQIFFGDERCVPPDHLDSNYRMVKEALLDPAGIPPELVHRIPGEMEPAAAAVQYELELAESFPGAAPRFDLVLLGMGADGHTASLFPGTAALEERERLVRENRVEKLQAWRVTMTLPLLNAARRVIFLVAGSDKAAALRSVLQPAGGMELPPAARVAPVDGSLLWLVDRAAAG